MICNWTLPTSIKLFCGLITSSIKVGKSGLIAVKLCTDYADIETGQV